MAELISREQKLQRIIEIEHLLNDVEDLDVLLERILTESREIVHADAGSIYVIEQDNLRIRYAQNNTHQKNLAPGQKLPFQSFSFPINEKSMCGYCVLTHEIVNEPDVYAISPDKKYSFNKTSDEVTGYRSKSIIAIPLINPYGSVLGVLQIINPQDDNGNIVPFDDDAILFLQHFASSATQALERAYLIREMVMRMIEMARFRDPKETGAHVNRVASYSVAIYDSWAYRHGVPQNEAEKFRDALRIAAMLHDVGKVGISDLILKKPGRFTDEEFAIVKGHTYIGASLFKNKQSSFDSMAMDVVLHHHQRWDGTGYPGNVDLSLVDVENPQQIQAEPISGEDIPLEARIVAIADVFDALSSQRVYKAAWKEEDVFEEIKAQRGRQFDPEIVDIFFELIPQIRAIQKTWPDV